jgi:hypothetical protein
MIETGTYKMDAIIKLKKDQDKTSPSSYICILAWAVKKKNYMNHVTWFYIISTCKRPVIQISSKTLEYVYKLMSKDGARNYLILI